MEANVSQPARFGRRFKRRKLGAGADKQKHNVRVRAQVLRQFEHRRQVMHSAKIAGIEDYEFSFQIPAGAQAVGRSR
jgi:hypothetical protein